MPGTQPLTSLGVTSPLGPPGMDPLTLSGVTVPEGPFGMDPLTLSGVASPLGPPGIEPLAPSGPTSPLGPPGISPLALSGVTSPLGPSGIDTDTPSESATTHGLPSGLTQSGGSATAGAAVNNRAAASAAMMVDFTERIVPDDEAQANGLVNRGGSTLSMATNGIHGQPGTMARPFSFSMASTILATPVSLSVISIVDCDFAVISDSM